MQFGFAASSTSIGLIIMRQPFSFDLMSLAVRQRLRCPTGIVLIVLQPADLLDAVKRAIDVQRPAAEVFVLQAMRPMDLLCCWLGVSSRDGFAATIVGRARDVLPAVDTLESLMERAWRLEETTKEPVPTGSIDLAIQLLSVAANDDLERVSAAVESLHNAGHSTTEILQRFGELLQGDLRAMALLPVTIDDDWIATIEDAVNKAERVAFAKLIVIVGEAGWMRMQCALSPHAVALLQDGLIQPLQEIAGKPVEPLTSGAPLPWRQGTPPPIDHPSDLVPSALQLEEDTRARSLAEALLASALELDARTRGLFTLNSNSDFNFGNRPIEIDLFCPVLMLAIEVDGYFHFQDKNAYRRDRAKDWLMQRHGLFVLRFLAEDVPGQLSSIVEVIADAVAVRKVSMNLNEVRRR